jgi:hypothetical protein
VAEKSTQDNEDGNPNAATNYAAKAGAAWRETDIQPYR